jgi:cytochrome c biogenesis protein CcmG, thiol:disulfide interchange protein DsbE
MKGVRAGALAVLLAALTACGGGSPNAAGPPSADLAAARAQADLGPCPRPAADRPANAQLPNLTLPCLGGGPDVSLTALGGVPMVINGWGSWCSPCRAELPAFQQLAAAVSDDRLRVVGIDTEDAPKSALDFAAAAKVRIPSLVDSSGAFRTKARLAGVPFTVFVRADGSIASAHVGPFTYEQLTAEVDKQLGVRVG